MVIIVAFCFILRRLLVIVTAKKGSRIYVNKSYSRRKFCFYCACKISVNTLVLLDVRALSMRGVLNKKSNSEIAS